MPDWSVALHVGTTPYEMHLDLGKRDILQHTVESESSCRVCTELLLKLIPQHLGW